MNLGKLFFLVSLYRETEVELLDDVKNDASKTIIRDKIY